VLGTVQVTTPDRSMDMLLNRWLLYQTLACRIWARSAFYQASGAYGFRDQLSGRDGPHGVQARLARQHVLRAAARQFVEGDVSTGGTADGSRRSDPHLRRSALASVRVLRISRSPRTRASSTRSFHSSRGRSSPPGSPSPISSPACRRARTLFEHCARRSTAACRSGATASVDGDRGLERRDEPRGCRGEGESVWLGWFLQAILTEWAELADARGRGAREDVALHAGALKNRSNERPGTASGIGARTSTTARRSIAANDVCRIDSIAQSWGVISGAAEAARGRRAMAAVVEYLVRREAGLVLLLAPPFDRTLLEPGYIKGICRASERTAASTPTRRSGRSSPSPRS